MKAYSIFLVVLMMVNFGIMAYLQKNKKFLWFIFMPFLFYVFSFLLDFYPSLIKQGVFDILVIGFSGILLFGYLKKYSFRFFYFLLCWIICLRCLTKIIPNEFEQTIANMIIGGVFFVYLSWISLLVCHKSKMQKIALFCTSSYVLALLFIGIAYLYNQESILKQIENINDFSLASLPFAIPFVGTILSSIIAYPIFYSGEILLFFLLCYEIFLKNPKGSHAEGPQDQGSQAPSKESNTPSHSSQSHPPRES